MQVRSELSEVPQREELGRSRDDARIVRRSSARQAISRPRSCGRCWAQISSSSRRLRRWCSSLRRALYFSSLTRATGMSERRRRSRGRSSRGSRARRSGPGGGTGRRGGRPRGSRRVPAARDGAVEVGARRALVVERLVPLGPLDPLADHVDGADQLAALGGVVGQDQVQVELAGAGLAQQPAADLLGAVVPEAGVEPGVPPADGAVALDVADQVRLGGLGRQGGQADDQGHRGRAGRRAREHSLGIRLRILQVIRLRRSSSWIEAPDGSMRPRVLDSVISNGQLSGHSRKINEAGRSAESAAQSFRIRLTGRRRPSRRSVPGTGLRPDDVPAPLAGQPMQLAAGDGRPPPGRRAPARPDRSNYPHRRPHRPWRFRARPPIARPSRASPRRNMAGPSPIPTSRPRSITTGS